MALIAIVHGIQQSITAEQLKAKGTCDEATSSMIDASAENLKETPCPNRRHLRQSAEPPPPAGMYSHVARMAPGELAFIAGQVAVDAKGTPVGVGDLAAQVDQVFANLGRILKDLGTDFESVVQFTTYITKADNIPVGCRRASALFPKLFPGGRYPPNTLLVVDRLVKPEFLLEVEAIARVPG